VEERTSGRAWRALLMSAGRAYGRAHDDPDCLERCRIYANRVQFSKEYLVVYALMIAVNLGLLVWVIIEADYPLMHPARWAFLVADLFVTSFVVLEVTLNMCAVGWRRFWQLKSNWFDFSVMLLCVVVIAMHALGPLAELEAEEEVETAILICRYTAQAQAAGLAPLLPPCAFLPLSSRLCLCCRPACLVYPLLPLIIAGLPASAALHIFPALPRHLSLAVTHSSLQLLRIAPSTRASCRLSAPCIATPATPYEQIARLGVMAKNMRRQAQHQDLRITLDDDRGCLPCVTCAPSFSNTCVCHLPTLSPIYEQYHLHTLSPPYAWHASPHSSHYHACGMSLHISTTRGNHTCGMSLPTYTCGTSLHALSPP